MGVLPACMSVHEVLSEARRVSSSLELKSQMVVRCYVGARNRTQILLKSSKYFQPQPSLAPALHSLLYIFVVLIMTSSAPRILGKCSANEFYLFSFFVTASLIFLLLASESILLFSFQAQLVL